MVRTKMKRRRSPQRSVIRFGIIVLILLMTAGSAYGWFDWEQDYDKVYVAGAKPDQHVEPAGHDDQAEGGEVTLPLSIRVHTREGDLPIQKVQVQWKVEGDSTWNDVDPVYEDEDRSFEFDWDEFRFGRAPNYTITDDDVTPGDTILVRIHVANLTEGFQNASLDEDTTDEGTNGWADQWVMRFETNPDRERPPMPGQR